MDLLQTVLNAQNGGAVEQIGRSFGLDQAQTTSAIGQLLPALAAGLSHQTAQPGGMEGLMAALTGGTHQRYLDDASTLTDAATIQDGNGILGNIFGSKDVSRQVAASASARTGIGADILQQMLPLVATLAMGALARQSSAAHAGAVQAGQPEQAGVLGMLTPLLDANKDGSMTDDVMAMLGKFLR
jgi:hypothetical protein